MTDTQNKPQEQYNIIESFYHGGRWYHPGQRFPPEGVAVDDDTLQKYQGVYLLTDKELIKRENPQAHQAQSDLEAANAKIAELTRQLEDSQSGQASEYLAQFTALFADEHGNPATPEQALEAVRELQADVGALSALVGFDGKGTPLPANFTRISSLKAIGLETYESLRGKTARQISAVEGITDEQATDIVAKVEAHFAKNQGGN